MLSIHTTEPIDPLGISTAYMLLDMHDIAANRLNETYPILLSSPCMNIVMYGDQKMDAFDVLSRYVPKLMGVTLKDSGTQRTERMLPISFFSIPMLHVACVVFEEKPKVRFDRNKGFVFTD